MSNPTPDEVRRVLAELLGWRFRPHLAGYFVRSPEGLELDVGRGLSACVPDPASDLNAMAAVEKAMTPDQLWDYAAWLAGASPGERGWQHEIDADTLVRVATAPAAVRALAAYRVLVAAKDE